VRPIQRSDQPGTFAEKVKVAQSLEENMNTRKIWLSPEDVQAVRGVADKADATQGDRFTELVYVVPLCHAGETDALIFSLPR
jgi:hypothetical protein